MIWVKYLWLELQQRLFYQLLTRYGCVWEKKQGLLPEDYEAAIMIWASSRPQNQTVLHLRATAAPNDERGPRSEVSGWEPATTGPPEDWYLYCCQLGRSTEHRSRPGREPLELEERTPRSEHWGLLAEICAICSCQVANQGMKYFSICF